MSLTEAQKQLRKAQQESLKAAFETEWHRLQGPELIPEFKFDLERRFRFDYLGWNLVAIELEGGTWQKGPSGHTTGKGYTKDCIKYNLAQTLGYRVFRLTSNMLEDDPVGHLQPIIELMRKATNLTTRNQKGD